MQDKIINLYPHNEVAYQALVDSSEKYPLSFLEHATGTGKSFIILKYLYNKMRNKRILFVTLHDEMFDQLFGPQMHTLGIDRSDFKQFDTMIYHNIVKYDMKELAEKYDCIIFDEAHHCGAKEWGKKILELKELILKSKDKKMIGLTATGIRYLDNYMDVSEVYFDGHVASRLPVSKAILKELLPAPLYVNSLSSCKDKVNKVLNKLNKVQRNEETISLTNQVMELKNKIEIESSISDLLKNYGVKKGEKYIVFCSNIKDLESKMIEAEEWFKNIGPVKMFQAHSGQRKDKNRSEINEFSKSRNEISLMFAVDIFNEGFHIDNVDGVLMFRKTQSPIIYLQQIGRALAFSLRRKQIKIFDFVDNISSNDVVRELYKEIVLVARKMIADEPSKREFYENILKRFEIVDYTTTTMQRLEEIERYLDENYTYRSSINMSIMKLREYRMKYPHNDILSDINHHKLDSEYLRAYNYLINADDYLTIENIEELNALNINFNNKIIMDVNVRRMLLKNYTNFEELKTHELEEFIESYTTFYQNHNRRPDNMHDEYEASLWNQHRGYLASSGKVKLSRILSHFSFKLTIEEIILTGSYPIKEEIDSYFNYLSEKIKSGLVLDKVEVRVLKRLRNAIPMNYYDLINYLDKKKDLSDVINNAINIILKYKEFNNDSKSIIGIYNWDVRRAYGVISKYAKYVNNEQFLKLISLEVDLPESINMSYEKRLELLDGYESFYERDLALENGVITEYFNFIIGNNRRPDYNRKDEKDLAARYYDFILKTTVGKLKTICLSFDNYGVEKSFYEKVIIGEEIPEKEINAFVRTLVRKIRSGKLLTRGEMRLLNAIVKKQSFSLLQEATDILDMARVFNNFDELYNNYKQNSSEECKRKLIMFVRANNEYITKNMLSQLSEIDISLPQELKKEINELSLYVCIKDKKLNDQRLLIEELQKYFKIYKSRLPQASELNKLYRRYLSTLYGNKLRKFLGVLDENNIDYNFEENALLGIVNAAEVDLYLKTIRDNLRDGKRVDLLTKRVLKILKQEHYLKNEDELLKVASGSTTVNALKNRITNELLRNVRENPYREIDVEKYSMSISYKDIKIVDDIRRNMIIRDLFNGMISRLNTSKGTIEDILSTQEYEIFNSALEFTGLDDDNIRLLQRVKEINANNVFSKMKVDHKLFIEEYLHFIRNNKGIRPSLNSSNEVEIRLAQQYDEVSSVLSGRELELIDSAIKETIKLNDESNFYDEYIDFIMQMKRFPCGNSTNPEEVRLNNLYLALNKNLTKEQDKEVKRLKKLYARATMQATINFNKMKIK